MKKFANFVVFAAMMAVLLSLSSCAKEPKEKEPENTTQPETQATPTTPAPVVTYTITIADGITNGTVTASKTSGIAEGETITLTITPATDYELDTISAGTDVTLNETGNTRTFAMPAANVTVTATFKWKWVGTKNPTTAKVVGDIVFNDGSAMPYADFDTLEKTAKDTKKISAIALIFYKGTSTNDTLGLRTLGVGLKHDKKSLQWCSNSANALNKNIDTIQCAPTVDSGSTLSAFVVGADKDGSDNLEQIAAFLSAEGSGTNDDTTGDQASSRYPAFYFAKNYKEQIIGEETASRIPSGSEYENGWYLPSLAELYQIYACRADRTNGYDIDIASAALGGDKFEKDWIYWSSSQDSSNDDYACRLYFKNGVWYSTPKNYTTSYRSVCAIRAFN